MTGKFKYLLLLAMVLLAVSSYGRIMPASPRLPETDTISPPPSGPDFEISGPELVCVGDSGNYHIDGAIGCFCIWTVAGEVLPDNSLAISVLWETNGIQTIEADVIFGNDPPVHSTLEVIVNEMPAPIQIWGDTLACDSTSHTYYTNAGAFDTCLWTVNGELQPGTSPAMTYYFTSPGTYQISVTVNNNCGNSEPLYLDVMVQGSAPAPPTPIQGPEESCAGDTEVYTTTIPSGLPCLWLINNVPQPTILTTLEVTWTQPGHYVIEARAVGECGTSNPATLEVDVSYYPDVDLGPDTTIYQGQVVKLDAGNPGCQYLWSTGDTTRFILVNQAGTYSVTASNDCGEDSDEIEVSVIVGLYEAPEDFPGRIYVRDSRIIIECDLHILRAEVITMDGRVVFSGLPQKPIGIPQCGIYMIRIVTERTWFIRKIFVP